MYQNSVHVAIVTTALWQWHHILTHQIWLFLKTDNSGVIFIVQCLLSSLLPDWLDSSHVCIFWRSPSYCGETAGIRGQAWLAEEGTANSVEMGSSTINNGLVCNHRSYLVLSIMLLYNLQCISPVRTCLSVANLFSDCGCTSRHLTCYLTRKKVHGGNWV